MVARVYGWSFELFPWKGNAATFLHGVSRRSRHLFRSRNQELSQGAFARFNSWHITRFMQGMHLGLYDRCASKTICCICSH